MKNIFTFLLVMLYTFTISAQEAANLDLVYQWKDDAIVGSSAYENAYNEVWGFVQNNREYAVIGSTEGTHIFDVDDTDNITEVAFVAGKVTGPIIVHRDYHDYDGYLYIVADEGSSSLQVVDLSNLPNSAEVVYDSNVLMSRSHNIFIDTTNAVLYSCGGGGSQGGLQFSSYSLENPEEPTLLANYNNSAWGYVHDAYVKDNIGYLHCGGNGFYIVDLADAENPVVLGVLKDYANAGYNHSGWLSDDGETYVMLDENHGSDVYLVDVSDFTDIKIKSTINSGGPQDEIIPHNAMIRGNYVFVSYYFDGLQVFDISDNETPCKAAAYDTSDWEYDGSYRGNWGLYCYLPSGLILASDMQEGLFVFKVSNEPTNTEDDCAITTNWCGDCVEEVISNNTQLTNESINVYPTIFSNNINFETNQNYTFTLYTLSGKIVKTGEAANGFIGNLNNITEGVYMLNLANKSTNFTTKIIKQ